MTQHLRSTCYLGSVLLGLGVLIALTGSALAADPQTTEPSQPAAKPQEAAKTTQPREPAQRPSAKPKAVLGRIMAVELERGMLTIVQDIPLAPDAATELAINDQTLVTRGAQRLGLEDLRPGEEYVRINYVVVDDRPVVLAITFEPLPNLERMSGTTQAIDLINGELVVKPNGLFGGSPKHFTINEATVITREGLRSYLTHLFIGDEATVDYTTDGERLTAHFVTVKTSQPSNGWFSGLGARRNVPSPQSSRSRGSTPMAQ